MDVLFNWFSTGAIALAVIVYYGWWHHVREQRSTDDVVMSSEDRRYHNERIYKNFEQFVVIMLATVGGTIAVLRERDPQNMLPLDREHLLTVCQAMIGGAGFTMAWLVALHHTKKVRYEEEVEGRSIRNADSMIYVVMVMVTAVLTWGLIPSLLR